MANIAQLEEALDNLVRVWTVMWPGEFGPVNLRGVVTKHRSLAAYFDNQETRKRILEDFVNRVLADNAVRAGQKLLPLSYKEIDERIKDIVERRAEYTKYTIPKVTGRGSKPETAKPAEFEVLRRALRGKKENGKEICIWFNLKDGCKIMKCPRLHICGNIPIGKTDPCRARHSKTECTKK